MLTNYPSDLLIISYELLLRKNQYILSLKFEKFAITSLHVAETYSQRDRLFYKYSLKIATTITALLDNKIYSINRRRKGVWNTTRGKSPWMDLDNNINQFFAG